jgi:hypothetical protein
MIVNEDDLYEKNDLKNFEIWNGKKMLKKK